MAERRMLQALAGLLAVLRQGDSRAAGLPEDFRRTHYDRCIRLPMRPEARSLNLSNSVAILTYEALRQNGFPGLAGTGEMANI